MLKVVAGIIINENQEILIAKRPEGKNFCGYWEFPGGKIERGETPFAALQRELAEEIGITVISANPFHQLTYDYPDKTVFLDFWQITKFSGIIQGMEGQVIKWVAPSELLAYQFPAANYAVIELYNKSVYGRM